MILFGVCGCFAIVLDGFCFGFVVCYLVSFRGGGLDC